MTGRPGSLIALGLLLCSVAPGQGQRGKQTARDLFYSEAGLVVAPGQSHKGRFAGAKKSFVAVSLGLKYRLWKLSAGQPLESDPAGPFQPGDQVRLGVEINDIGYLYIVHRQPNGMWRRVFPDPEIEHGNHFIHSGLTYPIPPEEGIELAFGSGMEQFFIVLARAPLKDLEGLVGPRQPENTVPASPPEVADAVLQMVRSGVNSKELLIERAPEEKAVYVVNRTAKPDSVVVADIRLASR